MIRRNVSREKCSQVAHSCLRFCTMIVIIGFLAGCGGGSGLKSSVTKGFGPLSARAPYLNYTQYFGYVSESIIPDGKHKNKDSYYLYFWVPGVIDEVGVSMQSPADKQPGTKAFKHPAFASNLQRDPKAFFDTYLALERLNVASSSKISLGGSPISMLATNDDSSEMPTNPRGSRYNSLLRHISDTGNPTKALVRGVYRITFTSFRGNVAGSYIATVGTNIPGVVIAPSLQELHKLVNS